MTMPYKKLLRSFVSNIAGLSVATLLVSGFRLDLTDYQTLMMAAGILVLVNILIKPLISLVSFPINVITLGFFEFIINALMLYLVILLVDNIMVTNGVLNFGYFGILTQEFAVSKFGTVLASATIISIINWLLKILIF